MHLPPGTTKVSATKILLPTGSAQESSPTINRNNAAILPSQEVIHSNAYSLTYNSTTKAYTFPSPSTLVQTPTQSYIQFPNLTQINVPRDTFELAPNQFVFRTGTQYILALKKLIFPGDTLTFPLSATISTLLLSVYVEFSPTTILDDSDPQDITALLDERPTLTLDGNAHLYDGSQILLNSNDLLLYNNYRFYPRGTQQNSLLTIIHPDGTTTDPVYPSYYRYYPTASHPSGFLIRPSDAAIVNIDGTFTKLDNSIVDQNGNVIQPASTQYPLYTAPILPPFIPSTTQTTFIVINHSTGSHQTITITQSVQATLLNYQWAPPDTANVGLYSGEFEITFSDNTSRTFPVLKDDALFIEVVDRFRY
jgi:hypothetical protein